MNARERIPVKLWVNYDTIFSTCMCQRYDNPNYELLHPIWHVVSSLSTIATTYYIYMNCDTMVVGEILFRATGKNIETYAKNKEKY